MSGEQIEEVEVGNNAPPPEVTEQTERQEKPERLTVRQSLEKTFEDAKTETDREETRTKGRFSPSGPARKAAEQPAETETETETPTETEVAKPTTQPPTAWAKDARDTWAQVPAQVQAAVLKREQDIEKGVNELKGRYAEIDKAIQPHLKAIEQYGKTPAQAVHQLFSWFNALATNPDQAFPALVQSYNYDPRKLMAAFKLQPETQQQQTEQTQGQQETTPEYVTKLEKELSSLKQQVAQELGIFRNNFAEQSMAKTQETLAFWAKDKPHFEKVRTLMGYLLTPDPNTGQAAIPLKDGKIDLDEAYNRAIYADPEVRALVLEEERVKAEQARKAKLAAETKAQQDQANKARKTATSVTTSAPGSEPSKKGNTKGKSVRESLVDAIEEYRA